MDGKTFIGISVANHGTVPCYIEQLGMFAFDNWFAYMRGKSSFAAISMDGVSSAITGKKLPFKLEPGARYSGLGKDDATVLCCAGLALAYAAGDLDDGAAYLDLALLINPNLAWGWSACGWVKVLARRTRSGYRALCTRYASEPCVDPRIWFMQHGMAHAHFFADALRKAGPAE